MTIAPFLRTLLVIMTFAMPSHAFGMAVAHGAAPTEVQASGAHAHHAERTAQETEEAALIQDCLMTMCCACLYMVSPPPAVQRAGMVPVETPASLPGIVSSRTDPPPRFS